MSTTLDNLSESDEASAQAYTNGGVRPVDQLVLELLRRQEGLVIGDFIERLEVTPTAVRARLDRLEEFGLIERRKLAGGRGRPLFQYFLTSLGWRQVGVTYVDLATALWHEVEALPDSDVRNRLLSGVTRRMGEAYRSLLTEESVSGRMDEMAGVLRERKIPCEMDHSAKLPVLTVHACPFPDLAAVDRRSACELEKEVLSQAVGKPLELSCCRLDGHGSCQFRPVETSVSMMDAGVSMLNAGLSI